MGIGDDPDDHRAEFVRLIERYQVITGEREEGSDAWSGGRF
jgi:hypothetical protein